ncbi:hypothetical protein GWO43_01110 [candidate division KSB1 bacterium]|nr:hypothetical protein [candidate division KSB1 bacterium]NIV68574.1 hypothetical protein [Phycisphaerae bacterium]NIR69130.1 hypothetical protein [candidate division KSB1 bacterium]NIS22661.1 hypothetical protein [candidate division KSB1 bacterium]NIT69519.1 hypothetical protein [candidate division KSB1 bacterium]
MTGRISILLGAGASRPFFKQRHEDLSTATICKNVLDENSWEKIVERYNQAKARPGYDTLRANISAHEVSTFLRSFSRVLAQSKYLDTINFEFYVQALDRLASVYRRGEDQITDPDSALFFVRREKHFQKHEIQPRFDFGFENTHPGGFHYLPYLIREIIASVIIAFQQHSDKKQYARGKRLFENFLQKIQTVSKGFDIISLNYDPLISEVTNNIGEIVSGFDETFNEVEFLEATNTVSYLHGHIGFVPLGLNAHKDFYFYDDYEQAQEVRFERLFVGHKETQIFDHPDVGINYNSFLTSGTNKIDSFGRNPYSAYYSRFVESISESELIIVMGLSLNEIHLETFLRNMFVLNKIQKGIRTKVIFVDLKSEREAQQIIKKRRLPDNLFARLRIIFSDKITTKPRLDVFEALREFKANFINELRNRGFGRLSNNIIYYSKGVEGFLQEFETVLKRIESD